MRTVDEKGWQPLPPLVLSLPLSLLLMLAGCGPGPGPGPGLAAGPVSTNDLPAAAPDPAGATVSMSKYQKMVGRWQRTDAEYVLDVRSIDGGTGTAEVVYLNPMPIHVARAEAGEEAGKLRLFVELQDVGYPGSTYRLHFFPATDQLYGSYYQAAIEQSFDVEFERVK